MYSLKIRDVLENRAYAIRFGRIIAAVHAGTWTERFSTAADWAETRIWFFVFWVNYFLVAECDWVLCIVMAAHGHVV